VPDYYDFSLARIGGGDAIFGDGLE